MLRFKLMASEVRAIQIGPDGVVEIDGHELVGDAGTWVVYDHQGGETVWQDPEFRATFEPVDEAARLYLELARRK